MSNERWLTKEDILKDLAHVTGQVTNIDDRFAVSGQRPPPVNVPDEEDNEFTQMYGECISKDSYIGEPDLTGITHMLRMVNEECDLPTYDDNENIKQLMEANTVVTISKINPNAPEFIPKNVQNVENKTKGMQDSNSNVSESSNRSEIRRSSPKHLNIKNTVCNGDDETNKTGVSHKNEINICDIDVTKKLDVSSLSSNDIKDISEKLKLKIVETSEAKCHKKKRERNLAMATLLKLHTCAPKSPENKPSPKLMTPEDFQTLSGDVPKTSISTEIKENTSESNLHTAHEHVKGSNTNDDSKESLGSLRPARSKLHASRELSSNNNTDAYLEEQNDYVSSKEVEESVKKVNNWFNGPEKKKQKPQPLLFGTVTFKRKATGSVNSSETPSLTNVNNVERPSSVPTSEFYVPSPYANELTTSYMKRSQASEVQIEDMWTKVQRQLREKDKELKKTSITTQARK